MEACAKALKTEYQSENAPSTFLEGKRPVYVKNTFLATSIQTADCRERTESCDAVLEGTRTHKLSLMCPETVIEGFDGEEDDSASCVESDNNEDFKVPVSQDESKAATMCSLNDSEAVLEFIDLKSDTNTLFAEKIGIQQKVQQHCNLNSQPDSEKSSHAFEGRRSSQMTTLINSPCHMLSLMCPSVKSLSREEEMLSTFSDNINSFSSNPGFMNDPLSSDDLLAPGHKLFHQLFTTGGNIPSLETSDVAKETDTGPACEAQSVAGNETVSHRKQKDRQPKLRVKGNVKGRAGNAEVKPAVEEAAPSRELSTIMLRNIPNKYTQKMLLDVVNEDFCGLYDFFYLPIDFRNKCNVGYAFINFIHSHYAQMFKNQYHGLKLGAFKSHKVCEVSWGRVQGLQNNIEHYRNSAVMSIPNPQYKPILFRNGVIVPFPTADGPLPSIKLRPQKC